MDSYEKQALADGYGIVAGVDEAGRGPLAGPVVAAAVIFSPGLTSFGIRDSKKLSPARRERVVFDIFKTSPAVGVGVVWPEEVDRINILRAALKAMGAAVTKLSPAPDILLVDGPYAVDSIHMPQKPIISGDSLSVTIAAASIIAKTTRDRIMRAYHSLYPDFNFVKNKGYGTPDHISALRAVPPSPIHRRSFSYGGGGGGGRGGRGR
ncbi:MAG: ribonuclease HII [Thermodesulfobacteriota bacterium]